MLKPVECPVLQVFVLFQPPVEKPVGYDDAVPVGYLPEELLDGSQEDVQVGYALRSSDVVVVIGEIHTGPEWLTEYQGAHGPFPCDEVEGMTVDDESHSFSLMVTVVVTVAVKSAVFVWYGTGTLTGTSTSMVVK